MGDDDLELNGVIEDDGGPTAPSGGGPTPIPEFATIAIPIATILGLVFLVSRKRNKEA